MLDQGSQANAWALGIRSSRIAQRRLRHIVNGKVVSVKIVLARKGALAGFAGELLDTDRVMSLEMGLHVVLATEALVALRAVVSTFLLPPLGLDVLHARKRYMRLGRTAVGSLAARDVREQRHIKPRTNGTGSPA